MHIHTLIFTFSHYHIHSVIATHASTVIEACCKTAAALCPEASGVAPYGLLRVGHVQGLRRGERVHMRGGAFVWKTGLSDVRGNFKTGQKKIHKVLIKTAVIFTVKPDICVKVAVHHSFFLLLSSDLAMQLNQGKFEYNGSCG